ncbi:hypothetical protein EII25_04450 [Erysipelotrichaceae bacterium OH741_COT-311]|nr:HAD-IA family hydrolase [Erysipelotrichaceae bacterium]RRC92474.1 hypothetical protein EII25_04450 [Erysipelotrichaceae bacterium OH741_COT-311]
MKYIIWDFNGTILDDVDICLKAENILNKRYRINRIVSKEEYLELFEFPVIRYYEKLGYNFDVIDYHVLSKEFIHLYDQYFHEATLMDGFINKIEESIALNNRNVIISASRKDLLLKQCQELKIDHYFDEILGSDNILGKGKMEVAMQWIQDNNIDVSRCLFIGDSIHDLHCAKAIDVACALVSKGHQSKNQLLKHTECVFDHLKDVDINL